MGDGAELPGPRSGRGRTVLIALLTALAAGLALKLLVLLAQSALTFFPVRALPATPGTFGLAFEPLSIATTDGETLGGWFIPGRADAGDRPFTIVHFHGNAENIASYAALGRRTHEAGHHLLLIDYRGYGTSSGHPSEAGIYRDGAAALAYLESRDDLDADRVVLWGRSIGACVAVRLAATDARVAGVILESSFTTARDLLREGGAFILYPLSFLSSYRFDQAGLIGSVNAPLLFIHGTDDDVAPHRLGRRLFDLAGGRKSFFEIDGGGHNDLLARHGDALWGEVSRFIASLD